MGLGVTVGAWGFVKGTLQQWGIMALEGAGATMEDRVSRESWESLQGSGGFVGVLWEAEGHC